ncbi:MAG: hypothetical protein ACRDXB_09250, partial [Actinomycetes bacterium]
MPSEAGRMYSSQDASVGAHHGHDAEWATFWGSWYSWASPIFGASLAARGDRMIATLRPFVAAAVIGLLGMVLSGLVPGWFGFMAGGVMALYWDAMAGGPGRAFWERRYPVTKELASRRSADYQTGFKSGQITIPGLLGAGYKKIGVIATTLVTVVVLAVLTVVVVGYLRGGAAPEKASGDPPNVRKLANRARTLARGTQHGYLRWLFSIPVGAVVTGGYMYGLLGGMTGKAAQLYLPGDLSYFLVGAISAGIGVAVLTMVPRAAAVISGKWWMPLYRLLGNPGAWQGLLGRKVQPGPVDEGRVLVGIAVLGVAMIPAAMVVWAAPLWFWPVLTFMMLGAVFTGWKRVPHGPWVAGSSSRSTLQNVG